MGVTDKTAVAVERGRTSFAWLALVVAALLALAAVAGVSHVSAQDATPDPAVLEALGGDGTLTNCVDPSFPPMEFYEDQNADEPVGFDIDLTTEIAARLGVEAEFIPMAFTGLLPGLQSGRCDVVASDGLAQQDSDVNEYVLSPAVEMLYGREAQPPRFSL